MRLSPMSNVLEVPSVMVTMARPLMLPGLYRMTQSLPLPVPPEWA
jgi:hypothetical protein